MQGFWRPSVAVGKTVLSLVFAMFGHCPHDFGDIFRTLSLQYLLLLLCYMKFSWGSDPEGAVGFRARIRAPCTGGM